MISGLGGLFEAYDEGSCDRAHAVIVEDTCSRTKSVCSEWTEKLWGEIHFFNGKQFY